MPGRVGVAVRMTVTVAGSMPVPVVPVRRHPLAMNFCASIVKRVGPLAPVEVPLHAVGPCG